MDRISELIQKYKNYMNRLEQDRRVRARDELSKEYKKNPDTSMSEADYIYNNTQKRIDMDDMIQGAAGLGSSLQKVSQKIPNVISKVLPSTIDNVKIDPKQGKTIASLYETLKHTPDDPKVKEAYDALIRETGEQYKKMLDEGFQINKIKPGQENPYKTSKDLHADIANKKMSYFPTEQGFGSETTTLSHPLLQKTDFTMDGEPMLANDLFRIVHDYRGHNLGGKSGFGPKGEQQAYLTHANDFSDLAKKALFTETAGQNNTVNWGKYGEQNRMNPANTIYADQKAALFPDEVINNDWHTTSKFEKLKELLKGK